MHKKRISEENQTDEKLAPNETTGLWVYGEPQSNNSALLETFLSVIDLFPDNIFVVLKLYFQLNDNCMLNVLVTIG